MKNTLSNGAYFKENPTKILGTLHPSTDRFGKAIVEVRGSMVDVKHGITVPVVRRFEHARQTVRLSDLVSKKKNTAKILSAVDNTKKERNRLIGQNPKAGKADLLNLKKSIERYNPDLSTEEITVWVTYQTNRGLFDRKLISQNAWQQFLSDEPDYLRTQIAKLTLIKKE